MAMWRREEPEYPKRPQPAGLGHSMASAVPNVQAAKREPIVRKIDRSSAMSERTGVVGIGKSIVIKGELSGNEDLTIEGRVEGKIDLNQNLLTVGENGKVKAQVFAKTVVIIGEVLGNVTAVEKVSIQEKVRLTATFPRREWRLPKGRTSAEVSTCGARRLQSRPWRP